MVPAFLLNLEPLGVRFLCRELGLSPKTVLPGTREPGNPDADSVEAAGAGKH